MKKLWIGLMLLICAVGAFFLGGSIAIVGFGISAGGGIPPSSNEILTVLGFILVFCSIIAFLIGFGMIVSSLFVGFSHIKSRRYKISCISIIAIAIILIGILVEINFDPRYKAKKQQSLISSKDVDLSYSCLMTRCKDIEYSLGKEQAEKSYLLSCQTIQENWSSKPEPYQIIPLMHAYLCLGNEAEKTDSQQAKKYWLKGLSYLQDDSVESLSEDRTYIINKEQQQASMMHTALSLLENLCVIDYKERVIIYPDEVNRYILLKKFTQKDIQMLISWASSERFTKDRDNFFEGKLDVEDSDIFLKPQGEHRIVNIIYSK